MRIFRPRPRTATTPYVARHSGWAAPALPPAPSAGVRLGFADGSEVELESGHPSALALRAVADLLVQDRPDRADNPYESVEAAEGS